MHVPIDIPLATWIADLISQGRLYTFYKTPEWLALRADVIRDHGNECEMCAAKGRYHPVDTVHHEYEVKSHPSMALTRYVEQPDGTRREVLHPLCNECHNEVHDRYNGTRRAHRGKKKAETTKERWD